MVPGEEVKDLLLAAGNGGQSFHNGTGCLPGCLCRRRKEHLQGTGGGPLTQVAASQQAPRRTVNHHYPEVLWAPLQEKVKGKKHMLPQALTATDWESGCQGVFFMRLSIKYFGEHA